MAPIRARLLIFASALIFAALAAVPARAEKYARIVSLYPGHTDTVVVAAHDLNAAIPFSDRYIALRGGALASCGAASALDEKILAPLYGIEFKKYTSEEGGRAWHPSAQGF